MFKDYVKNLPVVNFLYFKKRALIGPNFNTVIWNFSIFGISSRMTYFESSINFKSNKKTKLLALWLDRKVGKH